MKTDDYNTLMLVFQWPPATCYNIRDRNSQRKQECDGVPKSFEWSIHGLHPKKLDEDKDYTKKHYPIFCNGSTPAAFVLPEQLENRLKYNFFDVKSNDPYGHWRHQYQKHGTCMQSMANGPTEYFETNLKLFQKYNLNTIIKKIGIVPGYSYYLGDIYDALMNYLKKRVLIKCVKNLETEHWYLWEIILYFKPDKLTRSLELTDGEIKEQIPLDTIVYHAKGRDDIKNEAKEKYPLRNIITDGLYNSIPVLGAIGGLSTISSTDILLYVLIIIVTIGFLMILGLSSYRSYRARSSTDTMHQEHNKVKTVNLEPKN